MRLRVACKVADKVYGYGLHIPRYRRSTVARATAICRRRWCNDRVPFVPSESELHQRAEIFGCMMIDLAQALGIPPDECERKKDEFLEEMEKCRP